MKRHGMRVRVSGWFVGLVVVVFLVGDFGIPLMYCLDTGASWGEIQSNQAVAELRMNVKRFMVILWCAFYGLGRLRMHPVFNPTYSRWLQTTPWTSRMALPLGPAHLVWGDWVALAAFAALGRLDAQLDPFLVVVVFGAGYLVVGARALYGTGGWEWVILGFGFGAVALAMQNAGVQAGILAAMYVVFYIGLRRSLRRFPWARVVPLKRGRRIKPPDWGGRLRS